MDAIVVLCTAPDSDVARTLARGLVEARLAACVSVLPTRSVYRWEGSVEEEDEVQLLAKSTRERYAAIESWLRDAHPYDVPEILALPVVEGSAAYRRWIADETRPPAEP